MPNIAEDQMKSLKEQINNLDEQLKKPLPTPHVGCMVHWYPRGIIEPGNACAAIVTAQEGPGKVKLTVFKPNSMQEHKNGVHFVGHPAVAEKTHTQARIHNGVWAFDPAANPRKSHYELHTAQLKRKKDALLDQKRMQLEAETNKSSLEETLQGGGNVGNE